MTALKLYASYVASWRHADAPETGRAVEVRPRLKNACWRKARAF
jgi:hypothetical protein